jgi:hypothetical protein
MPALAVCDVGTIEVFVFADGGALDGTRGTYTGIQADTLRIESRGRVPVAHPQASPATTPQKRLVYTDPSARVMQAPADDSLRK